MSVQRLLIIGGAVVVAAAVIYFVTRPGPVEKAIRELAQAIEEERPEAVLARLHPDFADGHGTTYQQVPALLVEAYARYDEIRIFFESIEVQEGRDSAEATVLFKVVLSYQGMRGYAMGSFRDAERAVLVLRRDEEGDYRVASIAGVGKLGSRVGGDRAPEP